MNLVGYALLRIVGRRGSFFGVMAFSLVVALLAAFAIVDGGHTVSTWSAVIGTPLVVGMTIIASLEGSYDGTQGTMRYLVLTGVPRWKLVLVRIPALLAATVLVALPAMAVGSIAMLGDQQSASHLLRALGGALVGGATWGIVATAVGAILRSNGAGIAVAMVLNLMAPLLTVLVYAKVSETLANYLLPNVAGVVSKFGEAQPDQVLGSPVAFGPALAALLAWLAGAVALAMWRVSRDEY